MRLDQYLLDKGFFPSRAKAKEAISNGLVFVDGEICKKASFKVIEGREVTIKSSAKNTYVSRSGYKLEAAVKSFEVSVEGKICLDVGSSTGGFTQFLLNNGAKQIFAVDVGKDQMHESVAGDSRVNLFEETDIRDFVLSDGILVDLIVVDVSFISARKVIPFLPKFMSEGAQILLLFKPQFEVGKDNLKKGIYRDVDMEEIIKDFAKFLQKNVLNLEARYMVPTKGKKGNQEYFLKIIPSQERS